LPAPRARAPNAIPKSHLLGSTYYGVSSSLFWIENTVPSVAILCMNGARLKTGRRHFASVQAVIKESTTDLLCMIFADRLGTLSPGGIDDPHVRNMARSCDLC
jgi:hypothetical protein